MSQPVHMRKGVNYSGNSFSATYADSVIGTILAYGGSTAPYGWFLCQGQALSRTEYHELFEVIGTAFGTGDGSTTFNLPDLRGEFLRGVGNNSHTNQGNGGTVGEHQDATTQGTAYINSARYGVFAKSINIANYDNKQTLSGCNTINPSYIVDTPTTNADLFTSRPTNTSVNFIIKAKYSASPAGDVLGVQDIRDTLGETPLPGSLATTVTGAIKEIDDCNHYSTSETWTGKYWIDGKKIYQNYLYHEAAFPKSSVVSEDISSIGIDTPLEIMGSYTYTSGGSSTKRGLMPNLHVLDGNWNLGIIYQDNSILFTTGSNGDHYSKFKICFTYTKTT